MCRKGVWGDCLQRGWVWGDCHESYGVLGDCLEWGWVWGDYLERGWVWGDYLERGWVWGDKKGWVWGDCLERGWVWGYKGQKTDSLCFSSVNKYCLAFFKYALREGDALPCCCGMGGMQSSKFPLVWSSMTTETAMGPAELSFALVCWPTNFDEKCQPF